MTDNSKSKTPERDEVRIPNRMEQATADMTSPTRPPDGHKPSNEEGVGSTIDDLVKKGILQRQNK